MSSKPHTSEPLPVLTKDFDFTFVTNTLPRSLSVSTGQNPPVSAPVAVREEAMAFHEEFKSLVLAEQGTAAEEDTPAPIFIELFDPNELDWDDFLVEEAAPAHASSLPVVTRQPAPTVRTTPISVVMPQPPVAKVVAPSPVISTAPQQIVKPMVGPPLGTPLPIETWVVKVIAVLVGLNLLFAGLIVAGVRINDLFK